MPRSKVVEGYGVEVMVFSCGFDIGEEVGMSFQCLIRLRFKYYWCD